MKHNFNRRDFLKLMGLASLGLTAPRRMQSAASLQSTDKPNVLIIVFDAFSAMNVSLHGYGRQTTPNLARLAERATIYHNHYAGGNYTTSGTATLLTGSLPWTHRALTPGSGVIDAVAAHNIFNAFQGYYRVAFSHNSFVDKFFKQFQNDIDEWVPRQNLFLDSYDKWLHSLFYKDDDVATVSWARNVDSGQGYSYSIYLTRIYDALKESRMAGIESQYPRGIPSISNFSDAFYIMDDAVEWMSNRAATFPRPFLGYFHFLPPHAPYRASREFYGHFAHDGYSTIEKPIDIFADKNSNKEMPERRTEYDEFILYADKAFGDLYQSLETSGILENTWVVVTSDHGEMFERGIVGHSGATLYQPLIRVPLMIFEPGKTTRTDIHTPTSAMDLLPTLLSVAGLQVPNWVEGMVLPPYTPAEPVPNRNIHVVQAYYNEPYTPLTKATTAIIKGQYKLVYYVGYKQLKQDDLILLFDIESDPEELKDLSASMPDVRETLFAELKAKLDEVNKPYL